MPAIAISTRLQGVRYDLRGALEQRARELERAGRKIVYLNIGNPGRFGFAAPATLRAALRAHVEDSAGYGNELGLGPAREAIAAHERRRGITVADSDHIFIGNGVSELIDIALRALLSPGDEVLLPCPDYPLWSAATHLNGGVPRYYPSPAQNRPWPDVAATARLVTPRTRALVVINPNNPTGAVYPRAVLQQLAELARRHHLVLLADEIYDAIVYDGARFEPLAALAEDCPCLSFGGLSKVHRACGYRVGWMTLSGPAAATAPWREAMHLLAALRVCANVPGQWAIVPALEDSSIEALTAPGGRLHEARRAVLEGIASSRSLAIVPPAGAMYAFPSVRPGLLPAFDDQAFAMRLLEEESVLLSPGSSFNLAASRHVRLTLLPPPAQLGDVVARMDRVLQRMQQD